jgi:hypothetical protein
MASRCALFIALMLVAALARAETYKWVDERGVTTYSNTPPGAKAQVVGDRISVYTADPALNREVELYRRMDLAEAEWLQRQRLMAMQAAVTYPPEPLYRTAAYFPVSRVSFPARQSRRAASRRH